MWSSTVDPATGRRYYYNKVTKETSWTPPSMITEQDRERNDEEEDENIVSQNTEVDNSSCDVWNDPNFGKEMVSLLLSLSSPDVAPNSSVYQALNTECEDCLSILDDHCPAFRFIENPELCNWKYPYQLIEAIVRIILNEDFRTHRMIGLKILISLATDPRYLQSSFSTYQGWTSLISLLPRWKDDKLYALYSYLVAILQSSPDTATIIAASDLNVLTKWLEGNKSASSNAFTNSFLIEYKYIAGLHTLSKDSGVSIGDNDFAIQLLLELVSHSPSKCKKQAMSIAMSICCNHTYSTSLRVVARAQVLKYMNSSLSFQECVLDHWIDSAELLQSNSVPLPRDVPPEEMEDVCFDVFWSSSRDGKGFACLSHILYNAIPPLREQIEDFWENSRNSSTSLDLKSNVHSEVLSVICSYIHTNNFVCPANMSIVFEALSLSVELRLHGLYSKLVSCIRDLITGENVHFVYDCSKREGLNEIMSRCEVIIQNMSLVENTIGEDVTSNHRIDVPSLSQNWLASDPSNLDYAISESLQQVATLCEDKNAGRIGYRDRLDDRIGIHSSSIQAKDYRENSNIPSFEDHIDECDQGIISADATRRHTHDIISWRPDDNSKGKKQLGNNKKKYTKKEKHGGIYSILSKKSVVDSCDVSTYGESTSIAPMSAYDNPLNYTQQHESGKDNDDADYIEYNYSTNDDVSKINGKGGLIEFTEELSLRPPEEMKESRLEEISRPKTQKKIDKDKDKGKDTDHYNNKGENGSNLGSPVSKQKTGQKKKTKHSNVDVNTSKDLSSTISSGGSNNEEMITPSPSDEPVIIGPPSISNIEKMEDAESSVKESLKNLKNGLRRKSTQRASISSVNSSVDSACIKQENSDSTILEVTTVEKKTTTSTSKSNTNPPVSSPSKWKFESQQLRNAINSARSAMSGKSGDLDVSVVLDKDTIPYGMVKCPHCERNFSKDAGERHISRCQDIKAKPKVLKRGEGLKASTPKATQRYSLT